MVTVLSNPVLDVNVANNYERGMLGIDVLGNQTQEEGFTDHHY